MTSAVEGLSRNEIVPNELCTTISMLHVCDVYYTTPVTLCDSRFTLRDLLTFTYFSCSCLRFFVFLSCRRS